MSLTERQEQIVKHGKGNILISASAGSGKTYLVKTLESESNDTYKLTLVQM